METAQDCYVHELVHHFSLRAEYTVVHVRNTILFLSKQVAMGTLFRQRRWMYAMLLLLAYKKVKQKTEILLQQTCTLRVKTDGLAYLSIICVCWAMF